MHSADPENIKRFESALVLLKESTCQRGEYEFEAVGMCMEPVLLQGDILVVRRIGDAAAVRIGDILLYQSSACLCAHRYLYTRHRKDKNVLIIKSDNAGGPFSEEVLFSCVFGKVIAIKRGAREIRFDTYAGKFANMSIGVLVFMHFMVMRLMRRCVLLKCRFTKRTLIPGFWQKLAVPLRIAKAFFFRVFLGKN